jgi:hypothetical protein
MVMIGIVPDRPELERVRALCLALPDVTERLNHGSPTWFVRGKNDPPRGEIGHRGWVGVHLNRGLDWNEIAGAIEEAIRARG